MPLVAASIVPHSPILIPEIGKDNLARLKKTAEAFEQIREKLEKEKIETLIIISPHGPAQENAFTINLSQTYKTDFEEFGNFSLKKEYASDIGLMYKIRERAEISIQLQLITEEKLDHGVAIPLFLLTKNLPDIKIIPIYYSGLSNSEHLEFGKQIRQELFHTDDRIAVIASGDLSHRLTKDSPIGYSPQGKKFDKKIIDSIQNKKIDDLVNIEPELVIEAHECALKSILIILGIIHKNNYTPKMISYEYPFGIGYLVTDLNI